ncbi:MAG TPA: adenylate/guanylate cyclase domain-containing protein, partial [Thermoanaerobaculia bacterium]|nr:adenylate/guanylate cyclase domain-containing protein [Thermoanaerobaculia bacterium]
MRNPPNGTVSLMFTDIVGSTGLRDAFVAKHGESNGDRRYREQYQDPHHARIRASLDAHEGFEVKTIGDAFMASFENAENAIRCAAAIQQSLRHDPILGRASPRPLSIRIGIHTGAATYVERDGKPDYDGHAVNIAARVESLAGGERIYCSGETARLAKLGDGLRLHAYGPYALRGISERIEIFDVLWDDTLQPDPPAQPHDRLPHPWLTAWVGREREMAELEKTLRAHKLVTLHGTGGVGKTRMAVETLNAADADPERRRALPKEVLFVPLETVTAAAGGLVTAVRDALGLTEVDAPTLDALCRHLHGGDRLLLLDNFESVTPEAGLVAQLAATPGVRVLATSRHALGVDGEAIVELEPMIVRAADLAPLDSYRLFVELARRRDARWEPEDDVAMSDVLAATDGLPYLIELVAPVAPKRRLRQLADELKTSLRNVEARVKGSARPARHASVQACLEWALARLPEGERSALPRLAIFAGGFDAEAAETITATPVTALDVLFDASLLQFDRASGRYGMLPTTRELARDLLDQEQAATLDAAHARFFIDGLVRANRALQAKGGESQRKARRWIDAELPNVQQAVAWAEARDPELFARAVPAFGIYLHQTCRYSELVRLQEESLRRQNAETDPEAWAMTQNDLGVAYWSLPSGDRGENLAKAITCFEAALRVYTERDFPAEWARTQNNLGNAYWKLPSGDRGENLAKAIACYEAALRVRTECDFPVDRAVTQNNLGSAYADLTSGDRGKNLAKAIACYEAALRVRTERDFPVQWAMTQNNLGVAYRNLPSGDRGENL